MNLKYCTVPTVLTFFRLGFALTVSPFLLLTYLPLQNYYSNKFLALMIFVLVITDYLDGYLARRCNLVTRLGQILDPLADKCLVLGTLLVFVLLKKISLFWCIVILIREVVVTLLRYCAEKRQQQLKVSGWGKWKATLQYIYLIYTIGTPWFIGYDVFIEQILLYGAVLITVVSGLLYVKKFYDMQRGKL